MPKPRSPHIPSEIGICRVHGEVEFRIHKVGFTASGAQKFRRRCPECHSEAVRRQRKNTV